jgi:hypothetical protein
MESPSLMNFKNLLAYPFKDNKSGSKILIGSLLIFSASIIPLLPLMIVLGYIMKIAKRIIDGDGQLSLPEWDNWSDYLKDGFKWFAVLMIYALPLIIIFSVGYFVYFISFIGIAAFEETANPSVFAILLPFFGMAVLFLTIFIGIFLSLFEMVILPAGLMHVVYTGNFSSAFQIKQWWQILKKNFLGFMVAIIFLFGFYYLMMMVFSALYLSIVLCLAIPFALAPLSFLMGLWTIPLFAQAYREAMPLSEEMPVLEE